MIERSLDSSHKPSPQLKSQPPDPLIAGHDAPVRLFTPPDLAQPLPPPPQALPPLLTSANTPVLLSAAISAIDHSGRVGGRQLITALGWHDGDTLTIAIHPDTAIIRRDTTGRFHLDSRHYVFIPAAIRTMFGIKSGDRLLLVADEKHDALVVHPLRFLANLLADPYDGLFGGSDVQ